MWCCPRCTCRRSTTHWLTNSQFADIFSISQTAPGPSILIVTLVGYGAGLHVGGVPAAILGGVIATVAMVLPAASFVYVVTLFWQKAEKSKCGSPSRRASRR